jgi:hypothetical protein
MSSLGLWTLGCGGQTDEAPRASSASQSALAREASAKRMNACALFDREDIERITGTSLVALHDITDTYESTCEVSVSGQPEPVMAALTVYWKGGREKAEAERAGLRLAKKALNDGDVDIEELTGSGSVKGLADQAYFSNVLPSWVLKDDVFMSFIMPTSNREQTLAGFKAVSKKAIERLPEQVPAD